MKFSDLSELIPILSINNIDATHRTMLYNILTIGRFNHALEIGSWDGYSAVAFIAAMNDNNLKKMDFCDPNFQPRFHEVLGYCTRIDDVILHRCGSSEISYSQYDCVFVDGNHKLHNVEIETRLIIDGGVETVLAHDTNIPGPIHLMNTLSNSGYYVLNDNKIRPNENTDRGLMFATKNHELFSKIEELFACFS